MKKVTTYSMKGTLYLEAGQVVETLKGGEQVAHDYKQILEMLNREDVAITIKHIETFDEE